MEKPHIFRVSNVLLEVPRFQTKTEWNELSQQIELFEFAIAHQQKEDME